MGWFKKARIANNFAMYEKYKAQAKVIEDLFSRSTVKVTFPAWMINDLKLAKGYEAYYLEKLKADGVSL